MSKSEKKLPVDVKKYSSRTYRDTGQPYCGLGAYLNYMQRKMENKHADA